jgi:5'-deoxynucleotidase YfbR-like HD superfamily hydrolase
MLSIQTEREVEKVFHESKFGMVPAHVRKDFLPYIPAK